MLELVAANLTRWEGRYRSLERILKLRHAVVTMKADDALDALLAVGFAFPVDFMDDEFRMRLETVYLPILKRLHVVRHVLVLIFLCLTKGDLVADQQGRTGEERAYAFLCPKVGARHASHVRLAAQRRQRHEIV